MNRIAFTLTLLFLSATAVAAQQETDDPKLEAAKLGTTPNVHSFGKNLLCGQPPAEAFAEAKQRGIKVVITLREEDEVDWDEPATVKDLGLEFHQISFRSPDSLTDEIFDHSLRILAKSKKEPVMLHCGSANRVGAIWLAHRAVNDRVPIQQAVQEAKTVGLRSAPYEAKAIQYVQQRLANEK